MVESCPRQEMTTRRDEVCFSWGDELDFWCVQVQQLSPYLASCGYIHLPNNEVGKKAPGRKSRWQHPLWVCDSVAGLVLRTFHVLFPLTLPIVTSS